MSDRATGTGDAALRMVDTLLRAVETLPPPAVAWDIDLLRQALLIARATEIPADIERAELAYHALTRDSRARLAEQAARLAHRQDARRQDARRAPLSPPEGRRSGGFAGLLAALAPWRRAPDSGTTARDRLLREMGGGPATTPRRSEG